LNMHSSYAKNASQSQERSSRGAFVLVMVLVLLLVAALSLAGVARRSLESAEEAATAQEELQRRWGVLSALRLYLPSAESLLEAEAKKQAALGQGWPFPASLSGEFDLNGLHFSLLLADEDAKVNLNVIFHQGSDGMSQVAATLDQLAATDGLAAQVRPLSEDSTKSDAKLFRSWGQIFDLTPSQSPAESADRLRDATHEITCWGSGRLNICRASDQAIRAVCQNKVSPDVLDKLLSLRRDKEIKGLDDLFTRMALRIEDRAVLERLLSDRSTRHSIWIVVRNARRSWAWLAFDRGGASGGGQNGVAQEIFTW
jgi:type II secretory pathway component PulK